MNNYLERLNATHLHLIILKEGKTVFTSSKAGMRPLLDAIDIVGLPTLRKSVVIDKIVGKAAALLITYFKAREVHCLVLSVRAREVLDKRGIKHYAERIVPEVKNKLGTDVCPFEKAVLDVEDPEEAYETLSAKLKFFETQRQ